MKGASRFEDLLTHIDCLLHKHPRVIFAVDGPCASGKTTLAKRLNRRYGCAVFGMDDFFLRPEQRTPERLAQPGGNVDHARFLAEVLLPLQQEDAFSFRPFDCQKGALAEPVFARPGRLNIVEGSYSMHPALAGFYHGSAFLQISPELQKERILLRKQELHRRFFEEWIPLENHYFSATGAADRCGIILCSDQLNEGD